MKTLISTAIVFSFATAAHAAPIQFQFSSNLLFTNIPGVSPADTVTIDVVMDNGGTGTSSQFWSSSSGHFVSGTVTTGGYSMNLGTIVSAVDFLTNPSGGLVGAQLFDGFGIDNTDNFGIGGASSVGDIALSTSANTFAIWQDSANNFANWQIVASETEIPEPAPLALLGFGVFAMIAARRTRKTV